MERTGKKDNRECGWISVCRSVQDHWIWADQPFAYGQAWVDLLLLAQYEEQKFLLGSPRKLVILPRGALFTSQTKLAERWGWSRKKVHHFLQLLERDGMIRVEKAAKGMIVELCNYGLYQDFSREEEQGRDSTGTGEKQQESRSGAEEEQAEPQTGTQEEPQRSQTGAEEAPQRTSFKQEKQSKPGEQREQGKQTAAPSGRASACLEESFPEWAADLSVRPVSESDLNELVLAGASRELIRWAAQKAAGKGKGWAYARGIVRNSLQKGRRSSPSGSAHLGSRPSYDPEEFDRRGFELPPLPAPPESGGKPQSDMERYGWTDADFYLPPLPGEEGFEDHGC